MINNIAITIKINALTLAMIAYVVLLSVRDVFIVDVERVDGKLRIVMMISVEIFILKDEHICWTIIGNW